MRAGLPQPGSKRDRDAIAAQQPGFLEAYRAGSASARDACHSDGRGGGNSTAVRHWKNLLGVGFRMNVLRPIHPNSPLSVILSEIDVVECYAWWLVTQVGVNHETAKSYISTVNAWHRRSCHVDLAGGHPLKRIYEMLEGLARQRGVPPPRIKRVGVRPQKLRAGIDAIYPAADGESANMAACMETCMGAVRRAGELAVGSKWKWQARRHPTREDVSFHRRPDGSIAYATIKAVNSKAKGVEAFRKLPFRLPFSGRYLSPGYMLWYLTEVIDPVPVDQRATTPLFRHPTSGDAIKVSEVRTELRRAMAAVGLDASLYGAHSLRIGAATALQCGGASDNVIKACGTWTSEAYLRYLRETSDAVLNDAALICDGDVDDLATTDYLDLDAEPDEEDYE